MTDARREKLTAALRKTIARRLEKIEAARNVIGLEGRELTRDFDELYRVQGWIAGGVDAAPANGDASASAPTARTRTSRTPVGAN